MGKSTSSAMRIHAAMHRFVEQFEGKVESAVSNARSRKLAAIKYIELTLRYLYSRYLLTDQGTCPKKPSGLVIEPDFVFAMGMLDAVPLNDCLDRLQNAINALHPYEGKPFGRKPILLRQFRDMGEPTLPAKPGPEQIALAAMERAADEILNLFRELVKRLAAKCTDRAPRKKTSKGDSSGMLTPPQVAKQLGVSADKILNWIRKGELHAINVAAANSSRPRYRISGEDLAKFQQTRQNVKPPPKPLPRRKKDPNVIALTLT
ncbi:MAG: helix-turn-helix domain-containing protein [Planctomycetota bacterium]